MVRDQPDDGHNLNVKQNRRRVLGNELIKKKRKPPDFLVVFVALISDHDTNF